MATEWVSKITGTFEDKKRWRTYKSRKSELPAGYRTAIDGIERYFMYAGSIVKGDVLMQMLEDLADLIESAAADGTPIRAVVGDDPVEFADTFIRNYSGGQWIERERRHLTDAIDKAVDED